MSKIREPNLDNLLVELIRLRERFEKLLPSYAAQIKGLALLPVEFKRRFWVTSVEAIIQVVNQDYQRFEAQAHKADILNNIFAAGMNWSFKYAGWETVPMPGHLRISISVSPSGKIEPVLSDYQKPPVQAIIISYEKFNTIIQRLKDEILKGTIMPTSETDIPLMIYQLASKSS